MATNPGRRTGSPTSSAQVVMKSTPVATASSVSSLNPPAKPQSEAPSPAVIASPDSTKQITERAGTTAQALHELYGQHYGAYFHWGINE